MRLTILVALATLLSITPGVAAAQGAPRIAIEDDVSHDNAVMCLGVRGAQMRAHQTENTAPPTRLRAAFVAWTGYLKAAPGYDPAKIEAEAQAKLLQRGADGARAPDERLARLAGDCLPFEIESAPHAGG